MKSVVKFQFSTEKSYKLMENGVYSFVVSSDSTKKSIKSSVEKVFSVKVKEVRVLKKPSVVKNFKGKSGVKNEIKKAYVKLVAGEVIKFDELKVSKDV